MRTKNLKIIERADLLLLFLILSHLGLNWYLRKDFPSCVCEPLPSPPSRLKISFFLWIRHTWQAVMFSRKSLWHIYHLIIFKKEWKWGNRDPKKYNSYVWYIWSSYTFGFLYNLAKFCMRLNDIDLEKISQI